MKIFAILILFLLSHNTIAQQVAVNEPVRFLALGDSYTIGQSVGKLESWPYKFSDYLKAKDVKVDTLTIIAQTGWTTSNLKNALNEANTSGKYNLVSLLIGVNNQYQGLKVDIYVSEFEELLKTAIAIAGNKNQVFVISIPDYGYTPFGLSNQAKISQEIDKYNSINKIIADKYGVAWFNITDISRQGIIKPSLVASDGLHPSAEMYKLWVNLFGQNLSIQKETTTFIDFTSNNENKIKLVVHSEIKAIDFECNFDRISNESTIEVFTVSGLKMASSRLDKKTTVNVSKSGIYFYRITITNKEVHSGKVIVD